MNERIKMLRKRLNLTQEEFGKRIGIKQVTVASYENEIRTPTSAVILAICREYNVNESWLRDGIGEMFAPRTATEELTDFFADIVHEDSFRRRLVTVLSRIPPEEWKIIEKYALQLLEECKDHPPGK